MSGDYRKFGKHGSRKSRITFAGNGGGDGDHLNINSAGILQPDDRSKSMDSMAFDDPSLNLTDDDTFANVLDVTTASESEDHLLMSTSNKIGGTSDSEPILDNSEMSGRVRSADLRIQLDDLVDYSEDISKTTDSNAFVPKPSESYGSGSAHQDETESLTEFEEIERLIKANTAQDSDDDFSDIPEDLEKKIISGRISRGSNNSRQNSGLQSRQGTFDADVPLHSSRSSKSSSSSSS
uniref:Uncharacterized protein n=1 Tax=Ciona savignyi TaxID=51511 RepID=H2YZM3_CIOSA